MLLHINSGSCSSHLCIRRSLTAAFFAATPASSLLWIPTWFGHRRKVKMQLGFLAYGIIPLSVATAVHSAWLRKEAWMSKASRNLSNKLQLTNFLSQSLRHCAALGSVHEWEATPTTNRHPLHSPPSSNVVFFSWREFLSKSLIPELLCHANVQVQRVPGREQTSRVLQLRLSTIGCVLASSNHPWRLTNVETSTHWRN